MPGEPSALFDQNESYRPQPPVFSGLPGQRYDHLLIDTPPALASPATAAASTTAAIILIPTTPSPADIWEAEKAVEFARRKNPWAEVRVVVNRVRAETGANRGQKRNRCFQPRLPLR